MLRCDRNVTVVPLDWRVNRSSWFLSRGPCGTELRLDVLNIGDAVYEIRNGTGVGVGAPQFGIRRAILAGLTQRF
ncbi:MAG: hypothetical protein WBG11_14420 [Methylocella sp.]